MKNIIQQHCKVDEWNFLTTGKDENNFHNNEEDW